MPIVHFLRAAGRLALRFSVGAAALSDVGCASLFRGIPAPEPGARPAERAGILRFHPADFLSASAFPSLLVEIDHPASHAPDEAVLREFRDLLEALCDKPGGIDIRLDDAYEETVDAASEADVLAAAERHRSLRPAPGQAYLYILYVARIRYLRGPFGEAKGFAVRHFPFLCISVRGIDELAVLHLSKKKIEAAILKHEAGHLFGLVSNPEHQYDGAHCVNPDCLLCKRGTAVVAANFFRFLAGGVQAWFCDECLADLARDRDRPPPAEVTYEGATVAFRPEGLPWTVRWDLARRLTLECPPDRDPAEAIPFLESQRDAARCAGDRSAIEALLAGVRARGAAGGDERRDGGKGPARDGKKRSGYRRRREARRGGMARGGRPVAAGRGRPPASDRRHRTSGSGAFRPCPTFPW